LLDEEDEDDADEVEDALTFTATLTDEAADPDEDPFWLPETKAARSANPPPREPPPPPSTSVMPAPPLNSPETAIS
jgi:hypothetical protein